MSAQAAPGLAAHKLAESPVPVLGQLAFFTLFLAIAPISSYFLSEKYIWNGNSTYAAITAIVAANAVLLTYIIRSIIEDKRDQEAAQLSKKAGTESKKDR
ncbi:hypothetical protein FRC02_011277 [Tulasnella sp. 418]|nr:hypothetical protein FRC02_011277 [Tulasnella sp. 418]